MKKLLALALVAALAACGTTAQTGGPRTDWRCDGGAAYSVRITNAGAAEIFAGGQLYTLAASGSGYSNGQVSYADNGTLNGANGGPYTNCRRS
ncbi:hypothetical protein [Terricaulis sp.]|uniref:hypothetical protein n=1 Tax=Terricaulis sp. TaxID=2768686 RepID=UPI002AC6A929|nr:hypothetical protein [Terricaulis sp.]MDZ4693374.1 hypothetical protein [Terricaulis sp.]